MSAIDYVKELASTHRYGGTREEKEAQKKICSWFDELGYDVKREETEYISSPFYLFYKSLFSIFVILFLIATARWVNTLLIGTVFLGFLAFMSKAFPKIEMKMAKTKSENIIATINPDKEERLLLCAHYDSAPVIPDWGTKLMKVLREIGPISTFITPIGLLIVLFGFGIFQVYKAVSFGLFEGLGQGIWVWAWWFFLIYRTIFSVIQIVALTAITGIMNKKYSPGADDNASGIATMLEVSKRLKEEDIDLPMRIDLCSFASEERGLFGSREWVDRHEEEINKDKTYVLNLDCVGRGDTFFTVKGMGIIPKKHSDPELYELLIESLDKHGVEHEEMWGGPSDHAEFMKRKMRCVALMRGDTRERNIGQKILSRFLRIPIDPDLTCEVSGWHHKENDTVENISSKKLDETVDVVETFIRSLASKRNTKNDV